MLDTYHYLKLLQLKKGATRQEIKIAYRKYAFLYHPDRNRKNGHMFPYIHEAYRALMESFKINPAANGTGRANHNLAFIKEKIKKVKPQRNNVFFAPVRKVTERGKRCKKCDGYGMFGNQCLPMAPCRDCLGTGSRLGRQTTTAEPFQNLKRSLRQAQGDKRIVKASKTKLKP